MCAHTKYIFGKSLVRKAHDHISFSSESLLMNFFRSICCRKMKWKCWNVHFSFVSIFLGSSTTGDRIKRKKKFQLKCWNLILLNFRWRDTRDENKSTFFSSFRLLYLYINGPRIRHRPKHSSYVFVRYCEGSEIEYKTNECFSFVLFCCLTAVNIRPISVSMWSLMLLHSMVPHWSGQSSFFGKRFRSIK